MTQQELPLKPTVRVLIVDQFSGITPIWLRENRPSFQELCDSAETDPGRFGRLRTPVVTDVREDFHPDWSTTVLREGPDGKAVIWKVKWDSSG